MIVAILVAFLPVDFWTWSCSGRAALSGIVVLGLLGARLPAVNFGATTFLVYAAAAAGRKLEPRFARAGYLRRALDALGYLLKDAPAAVLADAVRRMRAGLRAIDPDLADGTVRNYLSEAIGKLGASNRIEAARIAREQGWL